MDIRNVPKQTVLIKLIICKYPIKFLPQILSISITTNTSEDVHSPLGLCKIQTIFEKLKRFMQLGSVLFDYFIIVMVEFFLDALYSYYYY